MPQATDPTTAGATFRAARQGAGLSVRAFAARAGLTPGTLSRWERGKRKIAPETYEHITQVLADYMAGRWAA